MIVENARLLIQKAFEEAETISDFKLKVLNVVNCIYDKPMDITPGYTLEDNGDITY